MWQIHKSPLYSNFRHVSYEKVETQVWKKADSDTAMINNRNEKDGPRSESFSKDFHIS